MGYGGLDVKLAILSMIALAGAVAQVSAKDLSQQHVINEDMPCNNPGGNEIYKSVPVQAPSGMFFEKETVQVYAEPDFRSFTDKAGPSGCFLHDPVTELIQVETKSGNKVKIPVLTGFKVYGHADCGSGELITAAHVLKGERIRMDCSFRAQLYSRDDLK
jgi:hypothetical protein